MKIYHGYIKLFIVLKKQIRQDLMQFGYQTLATHTMKKSFHACLGNWRCISNLRLFVPVCYTQSSRRCCHDSNDFRCHLAGDVTRTYGTDLTAY